MAVKDVRTTTFSPVYPLGTRSGGRKGNRRRRRRGPKTFGAGISSTFGKYYLIIYLQVTLGKT